MVDMLSIRSIFYELWQMRQTMRTVFKFLILSCLILSLSDCKKQESEALPVPKEKPAW